MLTLMQPKVHVMGQMTFLNNNGIPKIEVGQH